MTLALRRLPIYLIILSMLALPGCFLWSAHGLRIDTLNAYAGPELRVEPRGRNYTVIFTAPTGGWSVAFDRVRERFDLEQVFITLTGPPAGATVTQEPVEYAVDTGVPAGINIDLFVRVPVFGQPNGDAPYCLAHSERQ